MTKSYITMIEEAPDGSGDGILTFPDEMIAELGWKEGQTIDIFVDDFGHIILKALDDFKPFNPDTPERNLRKVLPE